jgi:hypothetical protein
VTVPTDAAPPNWSESQAVLCPLCTYNLRGLVEPLCPECGYRFEWHVLLDENLRLHPYLFEHHPERNIRSFVQTLNGSLSPSKFWSNLKPQQPSNLRRLCAYALTVLLTMLLALLASRIAEKPDARPVWDAIHRAIWAIDIGNDSPFFDWALTVMTWFNFLGRPAFYFLGLPVMLALWPWITLATLLVFAESMGRAKVRKSHVLRCVVYSSDILVFYAIVLIGVCVASPIIMQTTMPALVLWLMLALAGLVWLMLTWRLFRAYERYLRFDRALLTVLATQVIVFLTYLAAATSMWARL